MGSGHKANPFPYISSYSALKSVFFCVSARYKFFTYNTVQCVVSSLLVTTLKTVFFPVSAPWIYYVLPCVILSPLVTAGGVCELGRDARRVARRSRCVSLRRQADFLPWPHYLEVAPGTQYARCPLHESNEYNRRVKSTTTDLKCRLANF